MFYVRLVFVNIRRLMKYTLPLFCLAVLIAGCVCYVSGVHRASEEMLDTVARKYTTVIRAVMYASRPDIDLGQSREMTLGEVQAMAKADGVAAYTGIMNHMCALRVWHINLPADSILQKDREMVNCAANEQVVVFAVKNTEFIPEMTLLAGRHISDANDADGTSRHVLISREMSEIFGVGVGDTFTAAAATSERGDGLFYNGSFCVAGIVESGFAGQNRVHIFVPLETALPYNFDAHHAMDPDTYPVPESLSFRSAGLVLADPDNALAVVSEAAEILNREDFALQANDYEYKKEVYPIRTMMELSDIIGTAVLACAVVFFLLITAQSVRVRAREIAVLRLLACPRTVSYALFLLEKCVLLAGGFAVGSVCGWILARQYTQNASIILGDVGILLAIGGACLLLTALILLCYDLKKPMEVLSDE
ncbi:MAG: hypothetical protein IJ281_04585 [Clostridia bacterium]|nr:hypothetical protein [Clostridia bacterium]